MGWQEQRTRKKNRTQNTPQLNQKQNEAENNIQKLKKSFIWIEGEVLHKWVRQAMGQKPQETAVENVRILII